MTLQEIEAALDEGRMSASMMNGRWWKMRRNGKTKVWKTRPGEFRIPFKVGMRECGHLTPEIANRSDLFRVEPCQ